MAPASSASANHMVLSRATVDDIKIENKATKRFWIYFAIGNMREPIWTKGASSLWRLHIHVNFITKNYVGSYQLL